MNALLYKFSDLSGVGGVLRPGIVHRLDKGTSGLLVVAKNDESHRRLAAQLQARTLKRTYEAIAWGRVASPMMRICSPNVSWTTQSARSPPGSTTASPATKSRL